ncbi:MAG: SRPBCC domain-containing protein [Gemmatimonadaceae bacterium]|nr:SRPBCC domain-containing protein [Gemmatimonadaceae bacterium]
MPDILHRVGVKASQSATYRAITTREGLAGWWTSNTEGDAGKGGILQFRFGAGGFDIAVRDARADTHVMWEVLEGPEEWIGTHIRWELKQDGDYCIILFAHAGWREPVEFMHHCSTKWAIFLVSLKALVETGIGLPDPHDVKIDNWN